MHSQMKSSVLSLQDIHKAYDKPVLQGISLDLYPGEVLALLGANGSGKTTLVRILSTLSQADSGRAQIAGYDLDQEADQVRQSIALTGQFAAVDEELTARENLIFFGGLQGLSKQAARQRADYLLDLFRLDQTAHQLVREYSGGMKRRLDIAISMVVTPQLLFLDEPTTGLDPVSRREVWDMVKQLKEAGVSIFLTTQYLEEAEALADIVYILRQGKIALQGSPQYIKDKYGSPQCQLAFDSLEDRGQALEVLLSSGLDIDKDQVLTEDLSIRFNTDQGVQALARCLQVLDQSAIPVKLAALQPPSLESIFMDIAYQADPLEGGH